MLNRDDDFHQRSNVLAAELDTEDAHTVTSQAVVFEVLAYFSRAGATSRAIAADLVDRIRASATTEFVQSTPELFDAAVELYRRRLDKRYSLADCLGMIICRERSIAEVLTTDSDFEAEGFTILLKP
jgi:predicted nucleic acid-binding protein